MWGSSLLVFAAQRTDSTHKKSQPVVAEDISLSEFDEDFIRRVVEQVTVLSENEIEVRIMDLFYNIGKMQGLWRHNRCVHYNLIIILMRKLHDNYTLKF